MLLYQEQSFDFYVMLHILAINPHSFISMF
jgi:hypothetical protein